jgi:hypothetical protein
MSLEDLVPVQTTTRDISSSASSVTPSTGGQSEPNFLEQIARSSSPEPLELVDKIEGLPKHSVADEPHPPDLLPSFRASSSCPTSLQQSNPEVTTSKTWMSPGLPRAPTMVHSMLPMYAQVSFTPPRICPLTLSRTKGKVPTRPFSSSCKNSGKVVG